MSYAADLSPQYAPHEQHHRLRQAMSSPPPKRKRPNYRKRKRADDPYVEVVRQLQKDAKTQLLGCDSDCVNDDNNVCEHVHRAAVEVLRQTDAETDDWASFHESFPAPRPTFARHGTPERENDLWLRIKDGRSTIHPEDRIPDVEGTGQEAAVFLAHLRLTLAMLKIDGAAEGAIAAYMAEKGGGDERN